MRYASEGHREEEDRNSHRKRDYKNKSRHAFTKLSRKAKSHRSYYTPHKIDAKIKKDVPKERAPQQPQALQDQGIRKEVLAIFGPEYGGDASSPFLADIRDYQFPINFKMPDRIPSTIGTWTQEII